MQSYDNAMEYVQNISEETVRYRIPNLLEIQAATEVVLEVHIYFQKEKYTTRKTPVQYMVRIPDNSCPSDIKKVPNPLAALGYAINQRTTTPLTSLLTWKYSRKEDPCL